MGKTKYLFRCNLCFFRVLCMDKKYIAGLKCKCFVG